MAELFLARAEGPGGFAKTLALKRILPNLAEDPAFVAMFLSEARLASRLHHTNLVQIFDCGKAEGGYYLAMEYIDGPNLRGLGRCASGLGVPFPLELCAWIIAEACEGLSHAHEFCDPGTQKPLELVHRDVSLDNILVSREGSVKVVDFGIAKVADQVHRTQTGIIKGKLTYMPPEQLRGKKLDRRVDVYALGVVLYELLTSRKPFDATTEASIAKAILFEPLVPAVKRRPDLPKALQVILDRALAKDREQRYPDCRAFQADLERFIRAQRKPMGSAQLARFVERVMGPPAVEPPSMPPHAPPRAALVETRASSPRRNVVSTSESMRAPKLSTEASALESEAETTEQLATTELLAAPYQG
ncbi:Serine/threonine-protein kinase Pkn6 [Hyalangium minutum]|uniref:Serine/threonine-protein kinase Pkn6 n=2 Tax=Hyalangium minutum TaxID=394096 RepID=A0A085W4N3_9BACT|nr:Serine/threonine-protein kinase Pkn6 [Hyalangium minutum]